MEGLGYSKNRHAFRTLARTIPLVSLRRLGLDRTGDLLAVLLGAAQLLPVPRSLDDPLAQRYAAGLHDRWGQLKHAFPTVPLHPTEWLFFRLRPSNSPTARIAAFAHAMPHIFRSGFHGYLNLLRSGLPVERMMQQLRRVLSVRARGFWRYRTAFHGTAAGHGSAIGRARASELIINGVLPLSLHCADTFGDADLRRTIWAMISAQSATPLPRLLAVMHTDLFRGALPVDSPLLYQGAMELYHGYCARLRCRECTVGTACGFATGRSGVSSSSPRHLQVQGTV